MPNRTQTDNQNTGRGSRSGRGFAAMDEDKQRAIASKGGRAAHRSGNAHEFDAQEAREAGRRGGLARSASRASSRSAEMGTDQSVTHMQDLDQEPGSSRSQGHEERGGSRTQHSSDRGSQLRGRDVGDEPSTRMPGRQDGRSGHKGEGSMRTSDKRRTDANDETTRSGRGKHH